MFLCYVRTCVFARKCVYALAISLMPDVSFVFLQVVVAFSKIKVWRQSEENYLWGQTNPPSFILFKDK